MGNLVFQATLGGQVNLVGPNTASTYNLNVPTVNATLATTDANTFTAAQTISSGNLIFSGTGQKITGDYSNATLTSRAAFQTSTTNGSTGIYALPNGTSTAASWQATNAADPTNASKILIATNGSTDVQLVSGINGTGTYLPLTFYTNGSERMRLDTSGNLGLGVTPSAWDTSLVRAIQFGNNGAALSSFTTGNTSSKQLALSNNAYYDAGGWKYTQTSVVAQYRQAGQEHQWYTAGSGTAGNPITFTQAMTLDASGNLLVATTGTTGAQGFAVLPYAGGSYTRTGHTTSASSGDAYAQFYYNGGSIGSITQNGTTGVLYNLTSDYRLKNNPAPVTGAKEFVMALQPKTWDWWDGSGKGVGFIAHEFMEVAKYSGNGEKDAVETVEIKDEQGNVIGTEEKPVYQSIQPSSSEVMANLVAHIQELETRLATLEAK